GIGGGQGRSARLTVAVGRGVRALGTGVVLVATAAKHETRGHTYGKQNLGSHRLVPSSGPKARLDLPPGSRCPVRWGARSGLSEKFCQFVARQQRRPPRRGSKNPPKLNRPQDNSTSKT